MPNRIIKESIRTSDSINELSWFEECLFYRLIVSCDDYGRFDGRPAIIKGSCFPLKDGVTTNNIEKALSKLVSAGLVKRYVVDGKPYLSLPTWEQHQSVRAKKSKYPSPDDGEMITSENNCKQMHADVPVFENDIRNRNTINDNNKRGAETPLADVEPITLNDGTEWVCPLADYEEYRRLYPGVDIDKAFREMRAWCKSNPAKRKTARGIKRFVNGWLSRQQDSVYKIYQPNGKGSHSTKQVKDNNNFERRSYDFDALERGLLG